MRKLAWLLVAGLAMANVVAPGPAQAASETPEQLQTLQGADRKAAIVLARELGETKDKGALDVLLDALALGLHPEVTQVALEAVGMHQAPRSVDVLLAYTKYRDPAVRAQAVSALGRIDEPRATAAWKRALRDQQEVVRSAAARVALARKDASVMPELLALLEKGDEAVVEPIGVLATPDTAVALGELIGKAPDELVAQSLGRVLMRRKMGPETFYVDLVRTVGKVPGPEGVVVLTEYVSNTPERPIRQSRREAEAIVEARMSEGGSR